MLRKQDPDSPYNWKHSDCDDETIFPWEDVFECLTIPNINHTYKQCPKCAIKNDAAGEKTEIITVHFISPNWTWERLCGREGYLIICKKHKRQIDFLITKLN